MGATLRLGKLFGIPFGVNYSWFIIFALVTFSLSYYYFPLAFPSWPVGTYWLLGLVTSVIFFACVVVHELAHSAVSIATGVPVKEITLFIFGGVAQLEREASRPRNEFLMALAGPLASIGIGLLFGVIHIIAGHFNEPLAALTWWLSAINFSLGAFNLLPGFPLDGGHVLRSVIWGVSGDFLKATSICSVIGRISGYSLVLGGLVLIFQGLHFDGIWISFVGWFLDSAARATSRQTLMQRTLGGLTARDLMRGDFRAVAPDISVDEFVAQHLLKSIQRTYAVVEGEDLVGLISPQTVRALPRNHWGVTSVRDVMVPIHRLQKASASEDAALLFDRMDELNLNQLPVEESGRIVGFVARDGLLQFIRTRKELGV